MLTGADHTNYGNEIKKHDNRSYHALNRLSKEDEFKLLQQTVIISRDSL